MLKYRVKELSFIGNTLVQEGAVVDYEGEVGPNLEPVGTQPAKPGAPLPAKVPKAVADLLTSARMHAATRGDVPTNVNDGDFKAVMEAMGSPPKAEVLDQAKKLAAEHKAAADHATEVA